MTTLTAFNALFTLVPLIWAGARITSALRGDNDMTLRHFAAYVVILTCSLFILIQCVYRLWA